MDLISRTRFLKHIDECIAESPQAQSPIIKAVLMAIKCAVEQMPRVESGIEWHKVKIRRLTEEEMTHYKEIGSYVECIFDCEMPHDGQEILVATSWGVDTDICYSNDCEFWLDNLGDWAGVLAWAEIPKYEEG